MMIQTTSTGYAMSNPVMPPRLQASRLLAWFGYAALTGLFVGSAIGSAIIPR
jgi:hypothetical protein